MTLHLVELRDVESTAKETLSNSGYAEVKQIVCQYDQRGHSLMLRGRVSFFYLKQVAQELVRGLNSVERVLNVIEVRGTH